MEAQLTKDYFLAAGNANAEQQLAITVLVTELIEIATEHANSLGVGNPHMRHLNGGWVLSRLTVQMESYPLVNDSYRITTWVEGWNRHFSTRCFRITSPDESRVYGYARSVWMIMNTETRENLGLGHFSLPEHLVADHECPIAKQAKHHEIEPSEADVLYTFQYCDIDNYRHVNTVRYIQLLLNRFSLEHYDRNILTRLELSFLHEARYGMTVRISRRERDGYTSFSLADNASPALSPILFARLSFTPKQEDPDNGL